MVLEVCGKTYHLYLWHTSPLKAARPALGPTTGAGVSGQGCRALRAHAISMHSYRFGNDFAPLLTPLHKTLLPGSAPCAKPCFSILPTSSENWPPTP